METRFQPSEKQQRPRYQNQVPQLNQYTQDTSKNQTKIQIPNQNLKFLEDKSYTNPEEDLHGISNPIDLLHRFSQMRGWSYVEHVNKIGNDYEVTIDIDQGGTFRAVSKIENKARIKVILAIMYRYNSYFTLNWCWNNQSNLAKECLKS